MKLTLRPGVTVSGTLCLTCGKEHEPPFCESGGEAGGLTRGELRRISESATEFRRNFGSDSYERVCAYARQADEALREIGRIVGPDSFGRVQEIARAARLKEGKP